MFLKQWELRERYNPYGNQSFEIYSQLKPKLHCWEIYNEMSKIRRIVLLIRQSILATWPFAKTTHNVYLTKIKTIVLFEDLHQNLMIHNRKEKNKQNHNLNIKRWWSVLFVKTPKTPLLLYKMCQMCLHSNETLHKRFFSSCHILD